MFLGFLWQEFLDDYNVFEKQVYDLDRRLGSLLCQGFDDCSGLESIFKVSWLAQHISSEYKGVFIHSFS